MDPFVVIGTVTIVSLVVAVLLLLCRSLLALQRTRAVLAAAGVPVGSGSAYRQAVVAGRKLGGWISAGMSLLLVAAWGITMGLTHATEPAAVSWLLGTPMAIIAVPTLAGLLVLAATWISVGAVREVHRWLQSADAGAMEVPEPARAEGLRLLRRVTWSQAGVAGVGVVAGTVSVVFGALLVAALFVLASTAITCTRNPKCI